MRNELAVGRLRSTPAAARRRFTPALRPRPAPPPHTPSHRKRFFEELKGSNRAVVHFYRPTTRRCEIVDKHLFPLARKHVETKFVRVNAEKAPYLVEKLHIWMLPTLVCVKDGKTDHSIVGFDEMGGRDDLESSTLEAVLLKHGAVLETFCG